VGRGPLWTPSEKHRLRALWPAAPKAEVMSALPRRKWGAIKSMAESMGISRSGGAGGRPPQCGAHPVHPLVRQLTDLRVRLRMSRLTIGKRTGYHANAIYQWETGTSPTLHKFCDWANALGLDVTLTPKQEKPR